MRYLLAASILTTHIISLTLPAHAAIYKCKDESGKIAYQADPCPENNAAEEMQIEHAPSPITPNDPPTDESTPLNHPQYNDHRQSLSEDRKLAEKRQACERIENEYKRAKRQYEVQKQQKAAMEKQIVEDCKRRRETYCNQSASEILRQNQSRDSRKMLNESDKVRRNYYRSQKNARQPDLSVMRNPDQHYRSEMKRLGCDKI
ncbi:MAG TPA: DUF4124 domain-containing protein [Gammaproteobacteria bacterium]